MPVHARHAHLLQHFSEWGRPLGGFVPHVVAQCKLEVLGHHVRPQCEVLEHHADLALLRLDQVAAAFGVSGYLEACRTD
jgi:hypothetical protein